MMEQVYRTLPDDDPILSLCVVEDPTRCPDGYYVVNRTHDQDSDADLYRQTVLFGRRNTRYLCLSKIHGIGDLVIESVVITGEKDLPPASFCTISKTLDSEQRAWRKTQVCYKYTKRSTALKCVTDVILLSRLKKAPDGFQLGGDINGLTLCFKSGCLNSTINPTSQKYESPQLGFGLNALSPPLNGKAPVLVPRRAPPERPPSFGNGTDSDSANVSGSPHEYERLVPKRPAPKPPENGHRYVPSRPAPKVPTQPFNYSTLGSYHDLEGVPFVLNQKLDFNSSLFQVPKMKFRTLYELEKEFHYDFRIERQT